MIQLTTEALKRLFPNAPAGVIKAFVEKQNVLDEFGVNHTRNRLSYAFAQVEHESGGFRFLRENINYTPERAAQVWPSRFDSVADVYDKIGSFKGDPAFKTKLMNSVYGGRMGNRSGTNDGSQYIGRGGPQLTGRDCYSNVGRIVGIPLVTNPVLAEAEQNQPEIMAGFIDWKKLNAKADLGDFTGYVKVWNGGTIGLADRKKHLAQNKPIIDALPGGPPTAKPPKRVVDEATTTERRTTTAGAVVAGAAGSAEAARQTGTVQDDAVPVHPAIMFGIVGAGIAAIIIATVLIMKKRKAIEANWR